MQTEEELLSEFGGNQFDILLDITKFMHHKDWLTKLTEIGEGLEKIKSDRTKSGDICYTIVALELNVFAMLMDMLLLEFGDNKKEIVNDLIYVLEEYRDNMDHMEASTTERIKEETKAIFETIKGELRNENH